MSEFNSGSDSLGVGSIENKNTVEMQAARTLGIAMCISVMHCMKIMSRLFYWHYWRASISNSKILSIHFPWVKLVTAGFLLMILPTPSAWALIELPGDSVYHAELNWLDQNSKSINISELQGKVQVIAFVYTYCEHSCPVILANLRRIEEKIPSSEKIDVQFSLISLDPERDSPEVLKLYMQEHDLNECHWLMLNGNPDDVLEFSALLGVRYRPMNNSKKDISHSNMITVLDKQGRISYQMKGLNSGLEEVVSAISKIVSSDAEGAHTDSSSNCQSTPRR